MNHIEMKTKSFDFEMPRWCGWFYINIDRSYAYEPVAIYLLSRPCASPPSDLVSENPPPRLLAEIAHELDVVQREQRVDERLLFDVNPRVMSVISRKSGVWHMGQMGWEPPLPSTGGAGMPSRSSGSRNRHTRGRAARSRPYRRPVRSSADPPSWALSHGDRCAWGSSCRKCPHRATPMGRWRARPQCPTGGSDLETGVTAWGSGAAGEGGGGGGGGAGEGGGGGGGGGIRRWFGWRATWRVRHTRIQKFFEPATSLLNWKSHVPCCTAFASGSRVQLEFNCFRFASLVDRVECTPSISSSRAPNAADGHNYQIIIIIDYDNS